MILLGPRKGDKPATCPKCGRELRPWPIERGVRCSPKDWADIAAALEAQVAAVEALADLYDREADDICPPGEYDTQDKAWRVAHVRRRVAEEIRLTLHPEDQP